MVNVREIVKAFIEGKLYFDGRYLVYTRNTYYGDSKCCVKVVSDQTRLEDDYIRFKTFIHLSMCRDPYNYNEDVSMFINSAFDVGIDVEVVNELSDYIYTLTGVKMSAFTVEEGVMYIAFKGFEYPFREYKHKTTLVVRKGKGQCVKIYGYYNRFALFRDCKQCIEYANKITELRSRIERLYDEFLRWYYTLDSEDLENVLGSPFYRKMKEIRYEVHRLIDNNIIADTGMYIGKRSPRQALRAYERMAEKLEEMIAKARELHTLRSLTS
jgi:hypothetical protein